MIFDALKSELFRDTTKRQKMHGVMVRRRTCTCCKQPKPLDVGYQFKPFVCADCMKVKREN